MLLIINGTNRHQFPVLLESMFADRKRVFIDHLGWNLPVTKGHFEIDQLEDADAVYVVTFDDTGKHLGSLRLLRTDRPHILSSLFPQLCKHGVPQGAQVREITQLCISPSVPRLHRRAIRDRVISAMVDHALTSGVSSLTGVITAHFLDQILAMSWHCDALGDRSQFCGSTLSPRKLLVRTRKVFGSFLQFVFCGKLPRLLSSGCHDHITSCVSCSRGSPDDYAGVGHSYGVANSHR
jgi:N-acyl-L-homoserine lactone synthetase